MRQNFYELLSQRAFDVKKEYATLWKLFCVEKCYYTSYSSGSMAKWVNDAIFRKLKFRGSFSSLTEMMDEFGITERAAVDVNKLLLFCELLHAVLPTVNVSYDQYLSKQRTTIFQNITYILDRTNHEFQQDANKNWIIVEKNQTATMAAQLVTDTAVAFDLIEYNHFAIKGHLAEKKAILISIAGYIEPILNSKVLSTAGYKQLESDAGFVFNNFHIRHNNKEGSKANDYIATISNKDLEEWYDKAYELAVSVIIINDYLSIGNDIAEIKPKYTWRT